MLSADQMPAQIEQITDCSMCGDKSLSLFYQLGAFNLAVPSGTPSVAEIEAIVEPDDVRQDIGWEMMAVKYSFANSGNIGYLVIPYRVALC